MTDRLVPAPTPVPSAFAPRSLRDARLALTGLAAVFLFEMLDNSILTVALPTIGRELRASATGLQWVTGAYSIAFGALMLLFGAVADRVGRRRIMLIGLVLLGLAGLATAAVATPVELIAVRAAMGVAAAMTTPGSIALAFRLFPDDRLRVRAISLISTVGIVGLAVGPIAGGFVLAVAPWQVLLLVDVPVAALAFWAIRRGIPEDAPRDRLRHPIDVPGALLGTAAVGLALLTPTLFVQASPSAGCVAAALVVAAGAAFVLRERAARHPLLDLALLARPLVASGLAHKAATGLALAGMSYLVTLQLQLDYRWAPALAAIGLLPQVAVLLGLGPFVDRIVSRLGFERTAWLSAVSVVVGVGLYGVANRGGYAWIAVALVLVAAGIRINGVVAGTNVLRGLPEDRTSIGAALVDTAQEIATGAGVAVAGTLLGARVAGPIAVGRWTSAEAAGFSAAATLAALSLAAASALLVAYGTLRSRRGRLP